MSATQYINHPTKFRIPEAYCKNQLKLITLKNGISCLLISDSNLDTTAISVSVNSGSNNDGDIEGLAHLVEHAVFSGTKLFPRPYMLMDHVLKSGGSINAFTTFNQTNFHFEVPWSKSDISSLDSSIKSQDPILDYLVKVFSSFFKDPLFDSKFIKREIQEIDEEHKANLKSPDKKFYHCLKLLSSSLSGFHRFGTGNSLTLGKVPNIRKHLMYYFKSFYHGGNIKLVVKSPLSLNYQQKLVTLNFQDIPAEVSQYTKSPPILDPLQPEKMVQVSSDENKLRILFPISQINDRVIQIAKIWIDLLGQEKSGSICDYLVMNNLATTVFTSDQLIDTGNLIIVVEVGLTRKGSNNVALITACVLAYINKIATASKKKLQKIIDEFIIIEKFNFIHQDTPTSLCEVTQLSELIHYTDPNYLFFGYRLMEDLCVDLFISITQKWLKTDNIFVILLSSPADCQRKWYDSNFEMSYDINYLNSNNISPGREGDFSSLRVPSTNKFLSLSDELKDPKIRIYENQDLYLQMNVKFRDNANPVLLLFRNDTEVWYRPDLLERGKCFLSFQIKSRRLECKCKNFVLIDLLSEVLGTFIKLALYKAENIGYTWSLFPLINNTNSITFNLNGPKLIFEEVLGRLIYITNKLLGSINDTSYSALMRARVALRKRYQSLLNDESFQQALSLNLFLVEEGFYLVEERCSILEEVTLEDLIYIAKEVLINNYLTILFSGDGNRQFCNTLCLRIKELQVQDTKNLISVNIRDPSSFKPILGNHRFQIDSKKETSFCYFYIHLGERDDPYIRSISKIIEYLITTRLYLLKTKMDLGYRIGGGLRLFRRLLGVYVYVESGTYNSNHLIDSIQTFLEETVDSVKSLSDSKFMAQLINPLVESLDIAKRDQLSPDINFDLLPSQQSTNFDTVNESYFEHKSFWEKIVNKSYRFGGRYGQEDYSLDSLQNITRLKLCDYLDHCLGIHGSRSTLIITSTISETQQHRLKLLAIENKKNRFKTLIKDEKRGKLPEVNISYLSIREYLNLCQTMQDDSEFERQMVHLE